MDLPEGDQAERVLQILGILDDSDDPQRAAVDRPRGAEPERERRRDGACDGSLAASGWKTSGDHAQHRLAEDAVRILGPQVDRRRRTGYRHGLVNDRLGFAEQLLRGGQIGGDARRARARDLDPSVGIAEDALIGLLRVDDEPEPDRRRRHRHDEQRQHQDLLAPFAAQQPPRPPADRAAGRAAAAGRRGGDRRRGERRGHRGGPASSKDSGPGAGAV